MTISHWKQMKCRRLALVGVVAALAIAVLGIAAEAIAMAAHGRGGYSGEIKPSLSLPQNVFNVGPTLARQEWRIPFQVGNQGQLRLVINEVDSACGCGNPIRNTIILRPGELASLEVGLDTRFAIGSVESIATFTTNDPANPRFQLTVQAFVAPSGT